MLDRNYTNPNDRGRFGFSASGKYNAPYRLEHFIVALMTAVAAAALIFILVVTMGIVRGNPSGFMLGLMLVSIASGVVVIVVGLVVIIVAAVIIKVVMQGFSCSYLADDEKFTADIGGTKRTIYYSEVQGVHFEPRMNFFRKKVRGYTVTIKVSGANEEFGIVSDNYISEKTTPFYIIKERAELVRVARERERQFGGVVGFANNAVSASKSGMDETQKAIARMESMLGKDAEMPGISAAGISPSSQMPGISKLDSFEGSSSADNMPSVGAGGRVFQGPQTYTGTDGREVNVNDVVAQGSFRVVVKPGKAIVGGVIAAAVYAALCVFLMEEASNATVDAFSVPVVAAVLVVVGLFYFGFLINILRQGREYHYRANGREFVVTSKGIPDERFIYSDVQSVTYRKFSILFVSGYKVEILTRFGITRYNYVFPGFGRRQPTKDLPFEVIRERIERK